MILTKFYPLPDYNRREIMRYAGVRGGSPELEQELERYIKLCSGIFRGGVCYSQFSIDVGENFVDTPFGRLESAALAKNLAGCSEAIAFAATVGSGIDRMIQRYSTADVAAAVWLQAIGAERIETLCDMFCDEIENILKCNGQHLRPRFSPGYGDLSLESQRPLIDYLDCRRKIGVVLCESLLMSPEKSVTAIAGIDIKAVHCGQNCDSCEKIDCLYQK